MKYKFIIIGLILSLPAISSYSQAPVPKVNRPLKHTVSIRQRARPALLTYCGSGSDTTIDYISNVTIGSVNNSSYFQPGGYADYSIYNSQVVRGDTDLLTIINGNPGAGAQCGVWVDWNHNGNFLDDSLIAVNGGPVVFTAILKGPMNAQFGDARMRIVLSSDSVPLPCGIQHAGETEDYTITFLPVDFHEVEVVAYTPSMISATYPSVFYPEVDLFNEGLEMEPFTPVIFIFNGVQMVEDTLFDTLYPDEQLYFQFHSGITVDSCGDYPIIIYTSIPTPNDSDFDDDTVQATFSAEKYLTVSQGNIQNLAAATLQGNGISISNAGFVGNVNSAGSFNAHCSGFGLTSGILLSTGQADSAMGPNNSNNEGTNLGSAGDSALTALINAPTYDAAVLSLDIIPEHDSVRITYIFGSEEYPEFVNQPTDVFAIFVSGPSSDSTNYSDKNIALVPGTDTAVSVNTINYGVDDAGNCMNCEFYVKNMRNSLQADGYTLPLSAVFRVVPGATYHIKIGLADARDGLWDSYVFLGEGGISSFGTAIALSGTVMYDKASPTPLAGVTVKLIQNDSVKAEAISNATGFYFFQNLPAGNYSLQLSSTSAWSGVNAADALQILDYFVGSQPLLGLPLVAADLNGDQSVNSSDALLVVKRFVGIINDFPIHRDWIFESPSVTVTTSGAVIKNIRGICAGDVNRTYTP